MANGEFHERLGEAARGHKSVNGFSRKCGISNSLMLSYLGGRSLPGLNNLIKIAAAAQVSVMWLATGQGPKNADAGGAASSPAFAEAQARLGAVDAAMEKARAMDGRGADVSAMEDLRIYAFINGLDEKQIISLARRWGAAPNNNGRLHLKLLRSSIRMAEELLAEAGAKLTPGKKAEVISLIYEQGLMAGGSGALDREYAWRLISLAR